MLAVVVVEAVCLLLLGLLVAGLLRSHAEILAALHRLGLDLDPDRPADRSVVARTVRVGAGHPDAGEGWSPPAPDLVGTDLAGEPVLVSCAGGRDLLVLFLSAGCRSCLPFWEALRAGASGLPDGASAVAVVRDVAEEDPARLMDLAGGATVVASTAAWREFAVPGSPYAVWVDGQRGTLAGEGAAGSWGQVLDLLGHARRDARAVRPPRGDRDDAARIDAELHAAGIGAMDPRLFPDRSS